MENNEKKSKVKAILLYLFLAPFCIGDLYLGYKDKFKKQMLRFILIIIFFLLNTIIDISKFLSLILIFVFAYIAISIMIVQITNYIKVIKILSGIIKTDANGNDLI